MQGRVQECTLNAFSAGDFAHDEAAVRTTVAAGNDHAFVNLQTLQLPSTTFTLTMTVSPGAKEGMTLFRRTISSCSERMMFMVFQSGSWSRCTKAWGCCGGVSNAILGDADQRSRKAHDSNPINAPCRFAQEFDHQVTGHSQPAQRPVARQTVNK